LKISFDPCVQSKAPKGVKCITSPKQQADFIRGKAVELHYMNAHINITDFGENPTSQFINSDLFFPLMSRTRKKVNLMISPLNFEREEDLIQLG